LWQVTLHFSLVAKKRRPSQISKTIDFVTSSLLSEKSMIYIFYMLLLVVFLLGIRPSDTRGALVPFSFPGDALPLKKRKKVFKIFIGNL
jgi:hypothetical protein